jgi:hypothetical protein
MGLKAIDHRRFFQMRPFQPYGALGQRGKAIVWSEFTHAVQYAAAHHGGNRQPGADCAAQACHASRHHDRSVLSAHGRKGSKHVPRIGIGFVPDSDRQRIAQV